MLHPLANELVLPVKVRALQTWIMLLLSTLSTIRSGHSKASMVPSR